MSVPQTWSFSHANSQTWECTSPGPRASPHPEDFIFALSDMRVPIFSPGSGYPEASMSLGPNYGAPCLSCLPIHGPSRVGSPPAPREGPGVSPAAPPASLFFI